MQSFNNVPEYFAVMLFRTCRVENLDRVRGIFNQTELVQLLGLTLCKDITKTEKILNIFQVWIRDADITLFFPHHTLI